MSSVDVKPTNSRKAGAKAGARNEPFKRALASCTRALARQPELEVAYSADKPSLFRAGRPQGAAAGAAAQAQPARGGDHPRRRQFVRAAHRLPQ